MANESLILVVNPGSSSRKYALFANGINKASVHFEFEDGKITGKVVYEGQKYPRAYDDSDLTNVSKYVLPLLKEYKIIGESDAIKAIGIRVVAPSKRFAQDQLVTDQIEADLEAIEKRAPLHVRTAMMEVQHLRDYLPETPIVIVSDSAFHSTKPDIARYYGFDIEMADRIDVKKYGYHGVSVGSVSRYLSEHNLLAPKTVVCHLGSGSSITALIDGKSVDNTMGYTPLEGVMMASRTGDIDVSAALAIKRELGLDDDDLEQYLNKNSGLIGVSGSSNDIRQLLASEEAGDTRAKLALDMFVYRIQQSIGKMVASMGGVDTIVFTATIGERSSIIRSRILDKLNYLGFSYDTELNDKTFEPAEAVNVALSDSKPILVVSTDESAEIARRAEEYIDKNHL